MLFRNWRTFPWQRQIICVTPLCALLVFLAMFFGVGNGIAGEFVRIRHAYSGVTSVISLFRDWTQYIFYAIWLAVLVYGLIMKNKKITCAAICFFVIEILFVMILVNILKVSLGFPRPYAALDGAVIEFFSFSPDHHSLPSAHTAEMAIAVSCTAFCVPRRELLTSFCMGLILAGTGFSSIYLGRHHILDISAAILIGMIGSFCFHCLRQRG